MKKKAILIITAVLLVVMSCKKSKDVVKDDIKILFSDTSWLGEFKYAGRPIAEPVCIQFNATGTFTWYELDGDFPGTYSLNEDAKTVTLSFNGGSVVTATVTNNSKLTNFQYGAAYPWVINTAELLTTPVPELTGTKWNGGNGVNSVSVNFSSSTLLRFTGGVFATPSSEPYQLKHASLRFSPNSKWKFFGIIRNGKIEGIEYFDEATAPDFYRRWVVLKQ